MLNTANKKDLFSNNKYILDENQLFKATQKIATMQQFWKLLEKEMSMKRKTLIFKDFGYMFTIFVQQAFSEW